MRALLLCGGFATRLEPITYFIPKPLLPIGVGGKPIVEYILDDLVSSGVTEIVLSTNAKFSNAFEYWTKNQLDGGHATVQMVVEHTTGNHEKFGAIKGIEYAIEQAKIDEDLIIIAGDNLYDFSVKEILDYFGKHRHPTIGLYDMKDLEGAKRMGNAEIVGDKVVSFVEKPEHPKSALIAIAMYIIPKEMLGTFSEYLSEKNNPDGMGNFIAWLIRKTEVKGFVFHGNWHDIGTLETYKKVFDEYGKK